MPDPLNPLGPEKLEEINRAIATAEIALQAVQKAKLARVDTGDHEQALNETLSRLRAIKQVYFPGK